MFPPRPFVSVQRTAKQIRDSGVTVDPAIPDDEIVSPSTHTWNLDARRVIDPSSPGYSVTVKRKA